MKIESFEDICQPLMKIDNLERQIYDAYISGKVQTAFNKAEDLLRYAMQARNILFKELHEEK